MEDYKERPRRPESRPDPDAAQFAAFRDLSTPGFPLPSMQTSQSSRRVGDTSSATSSPAAGRYLASRTPLAASGQISGVVAELRQLLHSPRGKQDSTDRNDVLGIWMAVEQSLTQEEHRELLPAVLDRLFTDNRPPTDLSRDRTARAGGY